MRKRLYQIIPFAIFFFLSVSITVAQQTCEGIVAETLAAVGDNCDETGRNEACYGFQQVEASFVQDVSDDFFTSPSDITPLTDIQTLRTAPLQIEENIWGVAVMKVQANVPNSLPGQNVTFLLLGDVEVDNAVEADAARLPVDPVEIIVNVPAGANIRSGPGTNFNVIGGARPDTPLQADGVSDDGQWLRVNFNERPAWVSLSTIAIDNADYDSLAVVGAEQPTPMQAFYLRTGIGTAACEDVISDSLLIQGPENIEVTLTVNGADVNIGSSGILRIVYIDGLPYLENIVFDGVWDWNGVQVRRGQRTRLCLGDGVDLNGDGEPELDVTCDASEPEFVPVSQLSNLFCGYETMPPGLLNYPLDIPCPDDPPPGSSSGGGSGTIGSPSQVAEVDCSSFAIPAQTIIATSFTFDWPDVPGADNYVVSVFDQGGFELFNTTTTASSLPTNGGDWPPAGYVDVRAYRGGEYACFSRLNFSRLPNPNPEVPVVEQGLQAGITSCTLVSLYAEAVISWSNASTGSVQIVWDDVFFPPSNSISASGESGSRLIAGYAFANNIRVISGTETVNVGNCNP